MMQRAYRIARLREEHLSHVMKLQAAVLQELQQQGHGNFIVPKKEDAFLRYLRGEGGIILGAFAAGRSDLAGQAVLELPAFKGAKTSMTDMALPVSEDRLAIVSGGLVAPGHRGQGLQGRLLQARCEEAQRSGREEVVAEIELGNGYSLRNLLMAGFHVVSTAVDASDGARLLNMRRSFVHEPDVQEGKQDVTLPLSDDAFPELAKKLKEGYIGTRISSNASGRVLVLRPCRGWRWPVAKNLAATAIA